MGTGLPLRRSQDRLIERAPQIMAGIDAAIRRQLPRSADVDRLAGRAARAFAAGVGALAPDPAPRPQAGRPAALDPLVVAEEASARTLGLLLDEFLVAVDDHPDRHRLAVEGAVAMHRVLVRPLEGMDPGPARSGAGDGAARRRWARDVHDWVGSGVALALRQLELHDLEADRPAAGRGADRLADARSTLHELQHCTRRLIADLRASPWTTDLEVDLREFARRANVLGCAVGVEVRGDQAGIPAAVRDEVFLIVREAMRNAFTHAAAERVTVEIDIASGELRARVDDDGVGIRAPTTGGWRRRRSVGAGGSGMASMRERVATLGGRIAVVRRPGGGTRVEIDVATTPSARSGVPDGGVDDRLSRAG